MKTLQLFILVLICFRIPVAHAFPAVVPDTLYAPKTVYEAITKTPKRSDFLNVSLNTRIAFHTDLSHTAAEQSAFRLDYLRLQVSGNITDRIYYKWYQHLNRSNAPRSLDNTPSSIDCLGVGFHITPTLSTFVGKQYADYGGFEYDASPAEVYEYSDMGEYITCFLVGVNFSWQPTPTQELRLQIVDARSESAEETYGQVPPDFKAAKTPLGYTLNWNGNFLNERLLTRCSFSLFHEGKKDNVYFLALAAAWVQDNFNMYIDGMYSVEDIDKLGILSGFAATSESPVRARHSGYLSLVSRINYRILPKLNLFIKGMYETASARKTYAQIEKGKYRTSYGYQGGIEYFPMKENLRFYAMYRGRHLHHTPLSKSLGLTNSQPQHLSLGLIYNIPAY